VKTVRYSIGEDKIAYVRISSFKDNTGKQFIEAIDAIEKAGAVGVIFDLRNNGGGYLSAVSEMLSYIAPKGTELVSFSNNYSRPIYATHSHTFTLPSVVICNGYTASAAELFTSAMRDFSDMGFFDVLVVGETTYGKGVMQSSYPFTDGSVITVTVAYYYPPCRIGYDGEGISPKAENTVTDDESTEIDEQRERANSVIKELIGAKEEK
jgi:carboxyl-terminal processing protease